MSSLAEIEVLAPDGTPVRIGELVDRPTILIIPRYYGCLPCRDYLRQAAQRYGEIEAIGARAVGLSVGADFQAAWLIEQYGIPFPLLVDPERKVYDALELPRKLSVVLNPRGWAKYASAIARGTGRGRSSTRCSSPGSPFSTRRPVRSRSTGAGRWATTHRWIQFCESSRTWPTPHAAAHRQAPESFPPLSVLTDTTTFGSAIHQEDDRS